MSLCYYSSSLCCAIYRKRALNMSHPVHIPNPSSSASNQKSSTWRKTCASLKHISWSEIADRNSQPFSKILRRLKLSDAWIL